MRVLFIVPVYKGRENPSFPLGMAYVGSSLLQHGHSIEVIDPNIEKVNLRERLLKSKCQLITTGGLVTTYGFVKEITKMSKQIKPSVPILVGGGLASSVPELVLKNTCADIICIGEGEIAVVEVVNALESGKDLSEIDGIWFKKNGEIFRNKLRPPIDDLDSLPDLAWSEFNLEHYLELSKNLPNPFFQHKRIVGILTTRSCPYACTFCYHPLGKVVRLRSVDNVVNEIKLLMQKFGVHYFHIVDELFTIDKKRVMEFCENIHKWSLDIKWSCASRVNHANLEMFKAMKEAGCYWIQYGIESGNDKILEEMNKRITVRQASQAIAIAREAGLEPTCTFMFGMPGETEDTIRDTINFIKRENLFVTNIFFATPYPDSPLYREALKQGLITNIEEFVRQLGNAWDLVVNLTKIPTARLVDLRNLAVKEIQRHYIQNNKTLIRGLSDDGKIEFQCILCNRLFSLPAIEIFPDHFVACPQCSKLQVIDWSVIWRILHNKISFHEKESIDKKALNFVHNWYRNLPKLSYYNVNLCEPLEYDILQAVMPFFILDEIT